MLNSVTIKNNAIENYGLTKKIENSSSENSNLGIINFHSILSKKNNPQKYPNIKTDEKKDNTVKNNKSIELIANISNQYNHTLNIQKSQKHNYKIKNKNTNKNSKPQLHNNLTAIKTDKINKLNSSEISKLLIPLRTNNSKDLQNKINNLINDKFQDLNLKELKINTEKINLSEKKSFSLSDKSDSNSIKIVKSVQQKTTNFVNSIKQNNNSILDEYKEFDKNSLNPKNQFLTSSKNGQETKFNSNIDSTFQIENSIKNSKVIENIHQMNNNEPNDNHNSNKKQALTSKSLYHKIVKTTNFNNNKHLQNYIGNIQLQSGNNSINTDKSNTYEAKEFIRLNDITKEIVKLSKNISENTTYSARILLKPESLGTLFVKIQLVNNEVNIKLNVEQKEVMKILESQIMTLKENLEKAGLKPTDINFSFRENLENDENSDFQQNKGNNKENKFRKNFLNSFNLNASEHSKYD